MAHREPWGVLETHHQGAGDGRCRPALRFRDTRHGPRRRSGRPGGVQPLRATGRSSTYASTTAAWSARTSRRSPRNCAPLGSAETDAPVATITDFTADVLGQPTGKAVVLRPRPSGHPGRVHDRRRGHEQRAARPPSRRTQVCCATSKQPVITGSPSHRPRRTSRPSSSRPAVIWCSAIPAPARPRPARRLRGRQARRSVEETVTTDDQGSLLPRPRGERGRLGPGRRTRSDLGYAAIPWVAISPKAAPTRLILDKNELPSRGRRRDEGHRAAGVPERHGVEATGGHPTGAGLQEQQHHRRDRGHHGHRRPLQLRPAGRTGNTTFEVGFRRTRTTPGSCGPRPPM